MISEPNNLTVTANTNNGSVAQGGSIVTGLSGSAQGAPAATTPGHLLCTFFLQSTGSLVMRFLKFVWSCVQRPDEDCRNSKKSKVKITPRFSNICCLYAFIFRPTLVFDQGKLVSIQDSWQVNLSLISNYRCIL